MIALWPAMNLSRQRAASRDSNPFILKKLAATSGQFGRRSSQYRNSGFASASALATKGNPFSLLAISMLRLFSNEAAHSPRSPHLHMVRRLPL
jgi:hypothetical protein